VEASTVRDRPGHSLFWWGGILIALAPYLLVIQFPDLRAPWILEPGHFADNIIIAVRHILLGATLGGWLWFLVNRTNPLKLIASWWKQPTPLNWIWFGFSLVIYSVHNILLLFNYSFTPGELLSACVGRILTAVIVLSLLWLVTHIASLAAPRRFRLVPWTIPALLPGFIGADALGIIFWKNSLRYMVNKIDEEGSVNLGRQLAAGGFDHSTLDVTGLLLLLASALVALCYLSSRISLKISPRFRFRPQFAILLLSATWVGLAAEKAYGFTWKSRKALRMEHNSYDVHLTPIKPNPGVASFQASWHPAILPSLDAETQKKPDIYVIMLESTRADALDPAHTPFLCEFRDQECQQLGETWAASNGTHLSWFSIFNGQIPPYWADAISIARDEKKLPASPLIKVLQKADYRLEARTVCDLSYNGMGSTNFGLPHETHALIQADQGSAFEKLSIPERETKIIKQAKDSLLISPSSGNFHLIALDSPHFGYHWHKDFTPPYTEYDPSAFFHAYPEQEDIQRVKNRYFNALAWTDHLVEDFILFLKQQNRYDNSIIIVTGDHGEEFHEHGSWFHCSSLEKEQTGVPILIKWPTGTKPPAQKSASHLDILPSLLDYMGHPESSYAHLPGNSLLKSHDKEQTQITLTSFCGISGISMAWQRKGYTATFRWDNPWAPPRHPLSGRHCRPQRLSRPHRARRLGRRPQKTFPGCEKALLLTI